MGVCRFDAAKHMWPADMKAILDRLDNLPTAHGFPQGARVFVYQEVQDFGNSSPPLATRISIVPAALMNTRMLTVSR